MSDHSASFDIAIIGMAGRFPGSADLGEYWDNLSLGAEGISYFSEEELIASGVEPHILARKNYVRARGVVPNSEAFDADFFGFNPREAELMDPQHRIFLECAWEAFEDAGYVPGAFRGSIGVFAGTAVSSYFQSALLTNPDRLAAAGNLMALLGNDKDFLPTQVSYRLNLTGPSVAIGTACSTSLVATHIAAKALLAGECDMALAGGVAFQYPTKLGYFFETGGILSPDGHCRSFDEQALGTVPGGGAGAVVLRRLEDAVADRDHIYAVLKGSATNNDGRRKVGFTAPSVEGQAEVIQLAHAIAGVRPETITYIEAHGTATPIGDPIEIRALNRAFQAGSRRGRFCALGSVKSNIGHAAEAAGIAGLIKTALALDHRQIPPSLHFVHGNLQLSLEETPFYVVNQLQDWSCDSGPLRAGVSSFGIGGTNAHVVLEEAPSLRTYPAVGKNVLLTLSARSEATLDAAIERMGKRLHSSKTFDLADVAYTCHVGRQDHAHRCFAVCDSIDSAAEVLSVGAGVKRGIARMTRQPNVGLLFPGIDSRYAPPIAELYVAQPAFQNEMRRCLETFGPQAASDIELFLDIDGSHQSDNSQPLNAEYVELAEMAAFAVEYSLAKLWIEWGVTPTSVLGYGIGEYAAACIAGVFSLEDAVRLVMHRAALLTSLPVCTSIAVRLPEPEAHMVAPSALSVAAIPNREWCVLAGPSTEVEALSKLLSERRIATVGVPARRVVPRAMTDRVIDALASLARQTELHSPQIQYICPATGDLAKPEEVCSPAYWEQRLTLPVKSSAAIRGMSEAGIDIIIQVGQTTDSDLVLRGCSTSYPSETVRTFQSLPLPGKSDAADITLLSSAGALWVEGWQPNWPAFHRHERRSRVSLPTYPFEKHMYRLTSPETAGLKQHSAAPVQVACELSRAPFAGKHDGAYEPDSSEPDTLELEIQSQIISVWIELLGLDEIGLDDDFFEVGGDSLLATRLGLRISEAFGYTMPPEQMFERLTVRSLAKIVETHLLNNLGRLTQEQ